MRDKGIFIGDYENAILSFTAGDEELGFYYDDFILHHNLTGFGHAGYWILDIQNMIEIIHSQIEDEPLEPNESLIDIIIEQMIYGVVEEVAHSLGATHKDNADVWIFFFIDYL